MSTFQKQTKPADLKFNEITYIKFDEIITNVSLSTNILPNVVLD
jgi:hypothetical protein